VVGLGKDKHRVSDRIETVIGPNARFSGTLETDGGLRIDGLCEGAVEAAGTVIVGEQGRVLADIKAGNVSVSGAVKGKIISSGRLEILSSGKVWGDIAVASFLIEEGGFFRGQSLMAGVEEPPLLKAPAAQPEPTVLEGEVVDAEEDE
jgi:cytoskeletal protein CcmA (bactofilin family)